MTKLDFSYENHPCRIPASLKPQPGIVGKHVNAGTTVWIHYNTTSGQTQYGDYAYVQVHAPNRSQKIEDGETYVKAVMTNISWHYRCIQFECNILNKDGTKGYGVCIDDPRRLTLV